MRKGTMTARKASRLIAWLNRSFPGSRSVIDVLENVERTQYLSVDALVMIETELARLRRQRVVSDVISDAPKHVVILSTD